MKSKIFQYADMFFGTTDEFFGMKNKICQVIDNNTKLLIFSVLPVYL